VELGFDSEIRFEKAGYLEKLDLSYFPIEKMPPTSPYDDYFVDLYDGATNLVYNTESFPDAAKAPQKVTDIFDTQNFPGKRCFWGFGDEFDLEFALMADGVPSDQVIQMMTTKEGRDRALRKMDTIKDDIVYVNTGAESVQFVLDKQCDLGLT
jgi:putative spermidine/putrescine transport system substrate-binding protein